ncbi:MAG: class I SAM-dependent methyltransferase [Candidatus Pacebacteria bacterium]|nr:class I SAM-dependent methyltransferase [Candidatus Paceibacterota bacterium]
MKRDTRNKKSSKTFWNKEYQKGEHLNLSVKPSEDLLKFFRWLSRNEPEAILDKNSLVLDLGCGNGRNLVYMTNQFNIKGVGYDISEEAINQAKKINPSIEWKVRSIAGKIDLPDDSTDIVLDMMSSHFLNEEERNILLEELNRIIKPNGWLFFKSFLREGDLHAKRLLEKNPAQEKGSYIHPRIGVQEHTWTTDEIKDFFGPFFEIRKIEKSHLHMLRGKAFKRRTVTVYLQKKY